MTQAEALAVLAAGVAGVVIAVKNRDTIAALIGGDTPSEDQSTNSLQDLLTMLDPSSYGTDDTMTRNRTAFLDAIAYSEGTNKPGGYNALFGWPAAGRTFMSYADHPRRLFSYTDKAGKTIQTSAAGRYQITRTTFDDVAPRLGVTMFRPEDQDTIAVELIRQRGALADVDAGRFADAVSKVRRVWASLPGAGYNQPERTLDAVAMAYQNAGGTFA